MAKTCKSQEKSLGELIYSDTCGPFSISDVNGNAYVQIYIDDFPRMTSTFLMKHKSQTMQNLEAYMEMMHKQGYCIQKLRTDQGTEYVSREMQELLNENGIAYAHTGSPAHEKMHLDERMNRTLMEMTWVILTDSGNTKSWWGHAVVYATTIRNRCTNGTFQNQETPYGRFFHRDADLKVFKPFGCTNLIYIPLEIRTKLDITAERGMLVGVDASILCY